jgi:AAA domain/DnaB-like helicase N terminal domain
MALDADALAAKLAARKLKTDDKAHGANGTPPAPAQERRIEPRQPPASQGAHKGTKNVEDPLPSAPEIENAVLCAILYEPEKGFQIFQQHARDAFFFGAAREWFKQMRAFYSEHGRLDPVLFMQHILDNPAVFTPIGGYAYFGGLQGQFHPIDVLPHYLSELREKYIRRQIMVKSFSQASKAKNGDLGDLLEEMSHSVEDLRRVAGGPNGSELFTISDLLGFDSTHDPDCLIGKRYIVRGGSSLWAGGSGYGKSSLILQLAVYWGCGVPCFGLRPVRPLKSLIIQAENNAGDMGEQLQGVFAGISKIGDLDIDRCRELIERNVIIRRTLKTGLHFLALLDELLEVDKPDMAWSDPLFAFAGCDLTNQKDTTRFLRDGLFPIADKRGVAMNVVHHVSKPARGDSKDKSEMADVDYQYLGFGSSEIQNSFRAVNTLLPIAKTGIFKLVLSKRGERAGATDPEGKWTRTLHLTHSTEGICWLQTDPPEKPNKGAGRLKYTPDHILDEMSIAHGVKAGIFQERLESEIGMSSATFYRIWDGLKKNSKIKPDGEGGWLKTGTND